MTGCITFKRALRDLSAACKESRTPLPAALEEKAAEVRLRLFFKCLPPERLKDAQHRRYVEEALGHPPSDAFVQRLVRDVRGPQLEEGELVYLEKQQNGRCALCGTLLIRTAKPEVDHVIPLALGGKSVLSNYQLLCRECNAGKGKLLNWMMGAPFFIESGGYLPLRLRYCVLSRGAGVCAEPGCEASARTTLLKPVPIIPVQRGGRMIFDNLRVVCDEHASLLEASLLRTARLQLNQARYRTLPHFVARAS